MLTVVWVIVKAAASTILCSVNTMALVDKTPESVDVSVFIDSKRFASGSYEDTVDNAWEFVQRHKEVDAKLNDFNVYTTHDDVANLYRTKGDDFFGEEADYANSTIACRPKHVMRLQKLFLIFLQFGSCRKKGFIEIHSSFN